MKVWITKYALSTGIIETEAREARNGADMVIYRMAGDTFDQYAHGEGKDWHRTRESAVVRANEMRAAKLNSIAKQVKKLEALTF